MQNQTDDRKLGRARGLLYGRRKGKPLTDTRAADYADGLARHTLDLNRPCLDDPTALFDAPVERLMLEIGFGAGEHLIHAIETDADTGFIGVEPFVNGMAKLLASMRHHPAGDRLKVHEGDARDVLQWLPDQSLSRIDLFYPDPWPKTRHITRRFVGQDTLEMMARVLKPSGLFRFASDIDAYKRWTLTHIERSPDFSLVSGGETPFEGWPGTRYEAKALRAGRAPGYYVFGRTSA